MRETIAADHDCNQTCDLGDGSSEEGLNGRKASVKGSAALSMSCEWKGKENEPGNADVSECLPNPLHLRLGNYGFESDMHLHLQRLMNQS